MKDAGERKESGLVKKANNEEAIKTVERFFKEEERMQLQQPTPRDDLACSRREEKGRKEDGCHEN